ncbi:Diaminopimelate decarboxylase [bioreactor metagenome]|uniref:Diaminopimelate decarboxylase n=1 Tax=bioreactor metagenome TaxID=1076179 RepID=A0A644Y846_9ZZZZ
MSNKQKYERPLIRKLVSGMPNKFGMRTEYQPVTHIDGVRIDDLVEHFGSPLFVLSEATIRRNFRDTSIAFNTRYPKVQFAWSYKTNYLQAVCSVFHQEGSWAEVVSRFEYDRALELIKDPRKIIFNGPGKSRSDLELLIKNDSLIHIDHSDEMYLVIQMASEMKIKPRVAIRVNMDTGIYPMWDRFGFNYENGQAMDAINKLISSGQVDFTGLHCHIGTFMMSPVAYSKAAVKLSDLAVKIRQKYNIAIKYIDMGGGFPSKNTLKGSYLPGSDLNPSVESFAEAITSTLLAQSFKPEELPLLILETGRALVDDAGYLISSVIANKRLSDGRRATIIDAGVNILFTSNWYEHKISPAQQFGNYSEDTVVYGPLCMNIDVIRENVTLPPLNSGDKVVIHHVGAYNMTQWMQFITLRPAIVLIDTLGKVHLIRRSETNEDIAGAESLPKHLENDDK